MGATFWSQGLNRYAYAFNDPVNNIDPFGFQAFDLSNINFSGVSGYAVVATPGTPGGFTIDLDPSAVVPSTTAATSSATSPPTSPGAGSASGGASAATAAASAAATGANVATKLLGESYVGQTSTPGSHSSGATGNAAATSKPAQASPSAASQNKPGRAPVYDEPPVPNQAFAPRLENSFSRPEFQVRDSSEMYKWGVEIATFPVGGLGKGAISLIPRISMRINLLRVGVGASKAAATGTARVLQSGGNTITKATAKALGLTQEQARNAMHKLKPFVGADPKDVGKIMSNGDYVSKKTGEVLGNLFDFVD
jgi:hypothetical protein